MAVSRSRKEVFSAGITATGSPIRIDNGGMYRISTICTGFNGATVKLQFLGADGTTYHDITSASWTANGYADINMAAGTQVRVNISVAVPTQPVLVTGFLIT